jgi:F-type H+-transporting ATPase subunit delta
MHAASREALTGLRGRLDGVLARFSTSDGLSALSQELYAVAEVLHGSPRLRRTLADPTTPPAGRSELASGLFGSQIGASAMQVVRDAVAERWSSPWDLVDALESIADDVLFGAAEQAGQLGNVEDELFRFERILDAHPQLAELLDDPVSAQSRRVELLSSVIGGRMNSVTQALLEHALSSRRKHTLALAIDDLREAAAVRENRSVAKVVSAVALTSAQQTRLTAALSELYGRAISVHTAVDPAVRGGLVIRIGDEIIDGSVAARLTQARSALTG